MIKINQSYDVILIGGGPASTTAATLLQSRGHNCLIVERDRFPRYHIGESLIPHTYGTIKRLGLLSQLKKSHFPEKYSVRFVSPSGKQADPFYFSETIKGDGARTWQVERSEFDKLCMDNARDKGVVILDSVRVEKVLFKRNQAVGVRVVSKKNGTHNILAKVVVDASGRATVLGKQLGLKSPVPGLRKASLWAYYRGGKRLRGRDAGETTIFMIPEQGWFWYIPLPDDMVSVGIVASPDYLFKKSKKYEDVFLREVKKCKPLMGRLSQAQRVDKVRGLRNLAYINHEMVGNGWVMIGDAAAFLDPIYSSGLFLALGSAELAAGCIHDALLHNDVSPRRLGAYIPTLRNGVEVIRSLIHAFYDPHFNFRKFVQKYPHHRKNLIDCLVGDVVEKDMTDFLEDLAQMTPPPPKLAI